MVIFNFIGYFFSLLIYSYVHTLFGPFLPPSPSPILSPPTLLTSRQNLLCPFLQFCFIGYFTLVLQEFFLSPVLRDLPHVQISQVLSLCYAIHTSLLLSQDSGLVCFLLILLPAPVRHSRTNTTSPSQP
jgi:hypothetical protein